MPVRLDEIKAAIAKAETLEDALALADSAKAIAGSKVLRETIAKASGVDAVALRRTYVAGAMWAGHRLGQILDAEATGIRKKHGTQSRNANEAFRAYRNAYSQAGLSEEVSLVYRRLASVPADVVERYLKDAGVNASQAGLFRAFGLNANGSKPKPKPKPEPKAQVTEEKQGFLPDGFTGILTDFEPEERFDEQEEPPEDPSAFAAELVDLCDTALEAASTAFAFAKQHGGSYSLDQCRRNLEVAVAALDDAAGYADTVKGQAS